MIEGLNSEIQIHSDQIPVDSCYMCDNLLKNCVCISFELVDDAMDYAFGRQEKHYFKEGNFVTAVPGLEPTQGCYVIARNSADNWTVFRRYVVEGGKVYLEALNATYPVIAVSPEVEIIGVVKAYNATFE